MKIWQQARRWRLSRRGEPVSCQQERYISLSERRIYDSRPRVVESVVADRKSHCRLNRPPPLLLNRKQHKRCPLIKLVKLRRRANLCQTAQRGFVARLRGLDWSNVAAAAAAAVVSKFVCALHRESQQLARFKGWLDAQKGEKCRFAQGFACIASVVILLKCFLKYLLVLLFWLLEMCLTLRFFGMEMSFFRGEHRWKRPSSSSSVLLHIWAWGSGFDMPQLLISWPSIHLLALRSALKPTSLQLKASNYHL